MKFSSWLNVINWINQIQLKIFEGLHVMHTMKIHQKTMTLRRLFLGFDARCGRCARCGTFAGSSTTNMW